MSEKAIAKTSLRGRRLLTDAKGAPTLEHLADVRRVAGARFAALFARPDFTTDPNTGDTIVTWYHGASGDARPLRTLAPVARERVEQRLRDALAPAMGDLNDAVRGPILGRALHVANPDAIWAVGETPVLIDWGIVPEDVGLQREDRASLYAQTLGQFAPLAGPPPIGDGGLAESMAISADGDDGHRASRGSAVPEAASGAVAASQSQPASEKEKVFIRPMVHWLYWVPLMVLIVLLLLAILWLLLPGNRVFPAAPGQSEEAATEEALLEAENQALIERIERLREAREEAVCRPDGILELPGGRSPEGALLLPPAVTEPGAETQEPPSVLPGVPDALVTPAPERVVVPTSPESGSEAASADTATLDALIESSTVVVLGDGPDGTSLGSGFFIGPDLVITNHHVIDGMTQIFVTGVSLGEVAQAEVLASKGPFETTGGDFALLRVAGVQNQAFTVRLPVLSLRLNNVYAAGFPGDVMDSDAQFQDLVSGDGTAVPTVFITTGIVNSEQDGVSGERIILHSAPLSSGNSGGPLLDTCGQVIGVNTFVRTGSMRSVNIALTTQAMSAFLQQNGHAVTETTASCEPRLLNGLAAPPSTANGTADPQGPAE